MEKAHDQGMKIVLNPSPMNEKILPLPLNYVDVFMLNEVEAGQILGTDENDGSVLIGKLLEHFPEAAIVLTLGSRVHLCGQVTAVPSGCIQGEGSGYHRSRRYLHRLFHWKSGTRTGCERGHGYRI